MTWDFFWISNTWRTVISTISNIVYTLLTLWLVVVSICSIRITQKLSRNQIEYQKNQKNNEREEFVLREDILTTVIPVFSWDDFIKASKGRLLKWGNWWLKIYKEENKWKFSLIYWVDMRSWDVILENWEVLLETSDDIEEYRKWFFTKFSCIILAMKYYWLTSDYIDINNIQSKIDNIIKWI